MRLHELQPAPGAQKNRKRIGRGNGSGHGTTAGKGTKGQKARSGGLKAGFRGMSSRNQRMAKRRGFNNRFRTEYEIVNVGKLNQFDNGASVDVQALQAAGVTDARQPLIKILGDGDLSVAIHLSGVKVSEAARRKIEGAGGSIAEISAAITAESPETREGNDAASSS